MTDDELNEVWRKRDAKIKRLCAQGMSDVEIGRKLGLTWRVVAQRREETGAVKGRPKTERSKQLDEKIRALHAQGLTDARIAEELNVTNSVAFNRRRALGLKPNATRGRQRRIVAADFDDNLRRFVASGLTDEQIGKELNLPASYIRKRRFLLKLPGNRKKPETPEYIIEREKAIEVGVLAGKTDETIASELGCSKCTVYKTRVEKDLPSGVTYAAKGRALKYADMTDDEIALEIPFDKYTDPDDAKLDAGICEVNLYGEEKARYLEIQSYKKRGIDFVYTDIDWRDQYSKRCAEQARRRREERRAAGNFLGSW